VPSPNPGTSFSYALYSVAAVTTNEAWAVGGTDDAQLLLRWTGTRWRSIAPPGTGEGWLSDVDLAPDGTLFATGGTFSGGGQIELQRCAP
jgi:hypothetical protein